MLNQMQIVLMKRLLSGMINKSFETIQHGTFQRQIFCTTLVYSAIYSSLEIENFRTFSLKIYIINKIQMHTKYSKHPQVAYSSFKMLIINLITA